MISDLNSISSANPMTPDSRFTVYFDGNCPTWSREIATYRRSRGGETIDLIDASHCDDAALSGVLDRASALRRCSDSTFGARMERSYPGPQHSLKSGSGCPLSLGSPASARAVACSRSSMHCMEASCACGAFGTRRRFRRATRRPEGADPKGRCIA